MNQTNAGGSATNSGIDYQQRVAACFQIFLYTGLNLSAVLHEDFSGTLKSIHFETADAIDDLKLICEERQVYFLQAKRSINFSDAPGSEFIKMLDQFISKYLLPSKDRERYVLVTSSDSSRKVTSELRKIIESIRLNDVSFTLNPLNKSEKEVSGKFKTAFLMRYKELASCEANEAIFIGFVKRMYVEVMDVEGGKSLEKSAKLLLTGVVQHPDLIWALLIKNSLHYAANRASVNKEAVKEILDRHRQRKDARVDVEDFSDMLRDSVTVNGEYACEREVLLLVGPDPSEHVITQIPRFTAACSKRMSFFDNHVSIDGGKKMPVVYRGSSMDGLLRFIEHEKETFTSKSVTIVKTQEEQLKGDEACIKLYREYLERLTSENQNITCCLHCGKVVGRKDNIFIEIDDKDTHSAVGVIHMKCRRPIDRVLGLVGIVGNEKSPYLLGFDFKEWVSLSIKGGIMKSGLNPSIQSRAMIAWNSVQSLNTGDYCVKFLLEDETKRFAFHRGRIERMSIQEAESWVKKFNEDIAAKKAANDPPCYTTGNVVRYGDYSMLLKIKGPEEEIVEITRAEVARYSKQEARMHEFEQMYYAPLCLVVAKNGGGILNIGNLIPIISDPLIFDQLIRSWQKAGVSVDDVELKILRSDQEVDNLLYQLFSDEMFPVLDPVLDMNARLASGIPFQPLEGALAKLKKKEHEEATQPLTLAENPAWKQDDLVRIILPTSDSDIELFGRVMKDEVENNEGQRFVLFQPMEDGAIVEGVNLAIPSKYVSKWNGENEE